MFDLQERTIIRGYLDSGMTPDAIANYIGRVSDLEDSDVLLIRSAAADMLAKTDSTSPAGPPILTLLPGGRGPGTDRRE